MLAGLRVPGQVPLPPVVDAGGRAELGRLPAAAVDLDLDLADAPVLGPRDAADEGLARTDLVEGLRGVDPARDLDGGVGGPVPLGPVRLLLVVRRQREAGEPLAGADEPVQAGHDHPDGEPVLARQRRAVHADRDHGVAAVGGDPERRADGHAVDVGGQDLVGAVADAGPVEQVGEPHAEPPGAADVRAADVVGHAGEGDVALDQVHLEEVLEAEGDLLLDVAVDGERVALGVDDGQAQPGVDPVEARRRGPERADAGHLVVEARRERPAPGRWGPGA